MGQRKESRIEEEKSAATHYRANTLFHVQARYTAGLLLHGLLALDLSSTALNLTFSVGSSASYSKSPNTGTRDRAARTE